MIAFVFGIAEALMLKSALSSFTSGNYTKAVTLVLIKLLLYGAAAVLLVFVFPKSLYACLIGYAAAGGSRLVYILHCAYPKGKIGG